MSKKKKKKELQRKLIKAQYYECLANILLAVVTTVIAVITAVIKWFN